jgi:hypothetical protein
MLLRIICLACVICLILPPWVVLPTANAQAQTASTKQSAGKATKKKSARKAVNDTGRSQPAAPIGSNYGGVPGQHDARHGY